MPWNSRNVMSLKEEFIHEAQQKNQCFNQLCKKYQISRKTGYKWLKRFSEEGILGIADRSKRPSHMPSRINSSTIEPILSLREEEPAWGAKKLRQVLINQGYENLPSIASINRILNRQNKIDSIESNKRKHHIRFERENPNELWQMDFKGYFALEKGKCHPLTILDDCSRFSVCLKACSVENEQFVREGLIEAFREYGLPEAMTMDNGSPWKGSAGQRLSRLTVWLMRLGIKVGHSRPYHPQTQGKDERFHRTFKEEVLKYHNFQNLAEAQEGFDAWRYKYNFVRPHEALNMLPPKEKYVVSPRRYPEKLPAIEYETGVEVRHVRNGGEISFKGKNYYVGEHLKGEPVAVRQRTERQWEIFYVKTRLGSFEEKV